jgi:exonuclease III
MDTIFGTWNVTSLYMIVTLKIIARELREYKLDLVGVQEVRWEEGGTEWAEDYTCFCGQGNRDRPLGTGFFVHNRIVSAVSRVEITSDKMYIILRGRWCNIMVLNMHAPCKDKGDDVKYDFYEVLGRVFDHFPGYDMKTLLGDFSAKVGKESIFKPAIGNESLHEISGDNGVRVVNVATTKSLVVKSTTFPHRKIHKYSWTSPDGNTHNQIDHVLIDKRWHSSILDVRFSEGLTVILTTVL